MLNWIWLALVLAAVLWGGYSGQMAEVSASVDAMAKTAVQLVIGLVGLMVFMLGIVRVAFDGGLRDAIARALAPILRRLFPDVPPDHPAMGAMVMNMATNILGLGNAATPFGLKAMAELARLNRHRSQASDAMVLFLAINTSSITLMPPLGTVAVRSAAGSVDPWSIWVPTLFATTCSTLVAVSVFFALRGLPWFRASSAGAEEGARSAGTDEGPVAEPDVDEGEEDTPPPEPPHPVVRIGLALCCLALAGLLVREVATLAETLPAIEVTKVILSAWLLPVLLFALLVYGSMRGVRAYESAVAGAREGMEVAVRITPYLVIILVAVSMFRASGALDLVIGAVSPLTDALGVPAEVLPMALLRPLSGSGALGIMSEIITEHGPDSFIGQLTCTLMGSTETTFYVLALYLGAAGVRDGRHALIACLCGDVAGFCGAVAACHWYFG